jgi:N-acetylglucosamine kinase-like BadF-type ATPase
VALLGRDGSLVGFARSDGTSHEWLGLEGSIAALDRVIAAAADPVRLPDGGPVPQVGVFCLAGIDLPVDDRVVGEAIRQRHWVLEPAVLNDAFAVLRAGTERTWGIAVVCGAGMNCVAVSPRGETVRFPALGEVSGDLAAGGHWIGTRALGMAMRALDGRGERTMLEELVPAHFGLESPLAVIEALRVGDLDEGMLTQLSPVAFDAAAGGDRVAIDLLDQVAAEIVVMVRAALERLGMLALDTHVVLGGGVFRSEAGWFVDRISDAIEDLSPGASVKVLDAPPIAGAALLALDRLGAGEESRRRIREQLTAERIAATPRTPAPREPAATATRAPA